MKSLPAGLALLLALAATSAIANHQQAGSEGEQLRGIVTELLRDNAEFARTHKAGYFKPFSEQQHPRATVVSCADARVQMRALDRTPDGDLYLVRNIGNQIGTAEGSVEYGVRHLHTPLLIIVGHVACDAIKAAQGDYRKESEAIRRELATLKLPPRKPKNDENEEWQRGVEANVNNQVAYALKTFAPEVKSGKLTVIGAIYDFQNAMQQGQGRLVITNVNGATDIGGLLARLMSISGSGATLQKKVAGEPAVYNTGH